MTPPEVPYRIIPLTQNQITYVSPHRYEELNSFSWYSAWDKKSRSFYAVRRDWINGKRRTIYMHRKILGLGYGDKRQVDHRDHLRTLDNTDDNLRIPPTNAHQNRNRGKQKNNTSGYKGVYFNKTRGKWQARIWLSGKAKSLGYFDTPELAYEAYCAAALKYHGEFACLT